MARETEFGGGVQVLFLVGMMVGTIWVGRHADGRERALPWHLDRLVPLYQRLGPPKPGEWLAEHKEAGQTYRQYVAGRPIRPDRNRRTIYVQPLGEFSTAQRRIVDRTAKFLGIHYVLPVKVQARLTLSIIPPEARRTHPTWGDQQILSTYVLEHVLKPRLPDDACPEARFVKLIQFCRDHQLAAQQNAYQASLDALRQEPAHQ